MGVNGSGFGFQARGFQFFLEGLRVTWTETSSPTSLRITDPKTDVGTGNCDVKARRAYAREREEGREGKGQRGRRGREGRDGGRRGVGTRKKKKHRQ
jgi:hypothetical protein